MVQIYYNTENIEGHNRLEFIDFTENDNSVHYDIEKLPDENIFLRDIKFEDGDSDLRLCVTTMSNKVYCHYQNVYNLNLPQIKRIVIGKKTTPIPKDLLIPEIPNYSEPEDDTGTDTPPQPNNNNESKDDTSSWNTLWVLVFFGIVIIIVVYVYMTFQKKKQSFKDSTFINY